MKANILLALLITFVAYVTSQTTQNLCEDAKAKGHTFAPDPSDCRNYLFCERDEAGEVTRVVTQRCGSTGFPGNIYFEDTPEGKCVKTNDHCAKDRCGLWSCPPWGSPDIFIAHATSCTKYRFCRLFGADWEECGTGEFFNRATGRCVPEDEAPCLTAPPDSPVIDCTGKAQGEKVAVPGDCYQFAWCYDEQVYQKDRCDEGFFFDTTSSSCVLEVSPCSAT